MSLLSRANTLRRVIYRSLVHLRPLHRVIPLLIKSIARRVREGTWAHAPVDLRLRQGRQETPFRTISLGQVAMTLDEAPAYYNPTRPLPRNATIVDCGGNQGISVRHFKKISPSATVHVFEASRQYIDLLKHNLAHLDGVHIQHAAVTDRSGPVTLNLYDAPGGESLFNRRIASRGQEQVPGIALHDYLEKKKIRRVDLLKMDIEGAELLALRGLGHRIRDVHTIVGEIHPDVVKTQDVLDHLTTHGFTVRTRPDGLAIMFEAVNRHQDLRKAS